MKRLRIAVCGSGNRSRSVWQRLVRASDRFDLVGVQDPDPASLQKAISQGTIAADQTHLELDAMLRKSRPDALLACPVNDAHAAAIQAGLDAGCHVLVEKPFTTRLDDAVRLAALAQRKGLRLGVVQNWRTKDVGQALRSAIGAGKVGRVSHVFFRYLRDREQPHLPPYLFQEPDPVLSAMSIHHFDLFRFALADEVVHVQGAAFNPPWSRYDHPSLIQFQLRTAQGVFISYVATFSSHNGHLPIESLQVEGELGSLCNDSDYSEPPLLLSLRGNRTPEDLTRAVTRRSSAEQYDVADAAILQNFAEAVQTEAPLVASGQENLGTLAILEAARRSLVDGKAHRPQELLQEAPHAR